jgi:transcriptional regulator with GAF, ATPase, and Fis domain
MPLITVRSPTGAPVTYRFDQEIVTIGRSTSNDLLVRDPLLSRCHAELRGTEAGWVVTDRDSSNGTLLNGRPVRRAEPLADGDEITLGRTVLVFESARPEADRERPTSETDRITWSASRSGPGEVPVLIGRSGKIREMVDTIDKIAPAPGTVLITGENGTGKELVARRIHGHSPRSEGPFVVVNCPALPGSLLESELFGVEKGVATGVEPRPGLFKVARAGTLLLDEVGDLDSGAQAKILRALQEKKVTPIGAREPVAVDVRILAATNHDLEADIDAGRFRLDLYHRLNVFSVSVPPLRERVEDIPLLVQHFLSWSEGPEVELDPDSLDLLMRYEFPGNVRELEHLIERARFLAEGSRILPQDLPDAVRRCHEEAGDRQAPADRLYDRIVRDGESFWDVAHGPFLRREVSRDDARKLIARAHKEAGGSYKGVAELFRIEEEYKRLLSFLRNHDLGVGTED